MVGLHHELANIDVPVPAGYVGDHHVQPRPVGQGRINERRREVDPATRGLEHPFDQVAHLVSGQDRVGQLSRAPARNEDLARLVDPDLLDRGIIEIRLQWPETGDCIEDALGRLAQVRKGREPAMQRALVVVGHRVVNQLTHLLQITGGIQLGTPDQLPHLALDGAYGVQRLTSAVVIPTDPRRAPSNLQGQVRSR